MQWTLCVKVSQENSVGGGCDMHAVSNLVAYVQTFNTQTFNNSLFHFSFFSVDLPVSIDEAGIYVIGTLDPPDWLQTDAGGLKRHDVHQTILGFVTRKIGTDESGGMCSGVDQFLQRQ